MKPEPTVRRFTLDDVLPAALALLALVIGVLVFWSFLRPYAMQVGFDEGYEAAGVERLLSGRGLPYVDMVSIRGPFLYWSLAIMHLLTGRFQWTGTRAIGLVCCMTMVSTSFLSGWAAGWPLAGAIAGALYVFVIGTYMDPGGAIGIHAEPIAIAYISTAFFLVSYALYRARTPRRRLVLLVLGGALVAIGGLTKQTLALCCLPMLLWIVLHASVKVGETFEDGRPRWRPVLAGWALPFVAGGTGLVLLVLLRYALAGELKTFFFWSLGVSSQIYMEPFKGRVARLVMEWFMGEPWAIFGSILALTVAFGPALGRVTRPTLRAILAGFGESAFETVVGLMALLLLLVAAIPLRIWGHYFLPIWVFFGMTVGILVERFAVRRSAQPRLAQALVVLVFGALLLPSGINRLNKLANDRSHGAWPNPRPDAACAEIDRIAGPGREEIFIWGLAGDLYITCQRRCASMFTHTTVIAGIVPPFWNEPRANRVPPGSREKLLAELTARPPKVIIDHPISIAGTAMMDFPMYASFINGRYCRVSSMEDRGKSLTFYGRNDLEVCRQRSP